jgi:glycosyltransferase involved in cell wall biosynthesis
VPVERIIVVPNGIQAGKFLKLEDKTLEFVRAMNLLAADPLLLLPVRITPRKNIELAIRVLAALRDHFPDGKLVVTGPLGPHNPANSAYFNRLIALRTELDLEKAVIFLAEQTQDYLPDEVIADFYRLADALLLPSLEEGFGIPILEAGLVGLPVFCADIPALRALGEGFVTFFSPQGPPDQVAALIAQRLLHEQTYGLRRRVKQEFTWEHIYAGRIRPLLG